MKFESWRKSSPPPGILGGNYMRPGGTHTGMISYRAPYISFYAFTGDRPDNELRPVWLRHRCWTETRNSCTGLTSYRSQVNNNKSQTGFRNFKPVCFWVSDIFIWKNMLFCPENRHQAYRPGLNGWKNFIPLKVHTGLSSSRSHVNTPYPPSSPCILNNKLKSWN